MLCFREGCHNGIDEPGSIETAIIIGTRGSIGTSKAVVILKFCSQKCVSQFFEEFPTQKSILEEVEALCEDKKTNG